MIEITSSDILPMFKELLDMKYNDEKDMKLIKRFLGKKEQKIFVMKIDKNLPIIVKFTPPNYYVEIQERIEKFDVLFEVGLRDMIILSMGKIPLKSFLTGKLKMKGKLLDKILIASLLKIDIPNRKTANVLFKHYFLEE